MPTYDYHCDVCGNRFDAWQKMTDEPLAVCPKCAGHVHRVIHPTGILFKGSGFYSTDQRGATESAKPAPPEPAAAAVAGETFAGAPSGTAAAKSGEPVSPKAGETTAQPSNPTAPSTPAPSKAAS